MGRQVRPRCLAIQAADWRCSQSGRPSSEVHAWPARPHHLISLLQDPGGRGSEGAAPPTSPSPAAVFMGRAGPKGAATSVSPPGWRPRKQHPALQVSRTLTPPGPNGRGASPIPLVFRLAQICRVSPTEDPEGGGLPRRAPAAPAVPMRQRLFGIPCPGPEYRAVPLGGTARPKGRPLSSSPKAPRISRFAPAGSRRHQGNPPLRMGFKGVLYSGRFWTDDGGVQSTLRVRPPS
ncbi:hypothetical protein NDU88_005935 [Pleurodeles waltl]|uniref:Uncharacterized protein n=1 Tax=Pleurodeles waltl TaxID=8319 RepID=A0AAV7NTP4_PLEWA|nr:hypothetical protein NDU88_005935 [Pleurodeles waltl]